MLRILVLLALRTAHAPRGPNEAYDTRARPSGTPEETDETIKSFRRMQQKVEEGSEFYQKIATKLEEWERYQKLKPGMRKVGDHSRGPWVGKKVRVLPHESRVLQTPHVGEIGEAFGFDASGRYLVRLAKSASSEPLAFHPYLLELVEEPDGHREPETKSEL
ncbi:hypothetical protein AB1Y20_000927 [Prymnesium parvum]|uniref:Uncharacterized protein n=1 Tax=Prymnesium parvum TaxID=97485 RepID=A0AB34K6S2_PRYPA